MIYLFSSITCTPCQIAKEYLNNNNIEYTVIDIDDNPEEVKKHKIKTVPTLLVIKDGQKQYIEGWHRNMLLKLLKEGE